MKKHLYASFGSKRGILNYSKYYLLQSLGRYAAFKDIEWERVRRLTFICQGNICRSPWGEGYAASLGMNADSYGIDCAEGHTADPRAIDYAGSVGVDLSKHRTRHIRNLVAQSTDLLIVMEPHHLIGVQSFVGDAQLTLAGLWAPNSHPYIHDPYGSGLEYFHRCEIKIAQAVDNMRKRIELYSRPQ